jgi:transposase
MPKKGQQYKKYSIEFKLKAVKMYLEDGMGWDMVTKKLNLPTNRHIRRWVKAYRESGVLGLEDQRGKSVYGTKKKPSKKPMSLEEEVEYLRAQNDLLKKILAFKRR